MLLRPYLPVAHRSAETTAVIQLSVSLLVTLAAVVLGLPITSVKGAFDTTGNDIRGYSALIIELDHTLSEYGPDSAHARALLRDYTANVIATTWPEEKPPVEATMRDDGAGQVESRVLGEKLYEIEHVIRAFTPSGATQAGVAASCLDTYQRLIRQRWKLIEEAHPSIATPFFLVLVSWLVALFVCFGLIAPRNLLAGTIVVIAALSLCSALYVVLDMDTPFTGPVVVASSPMRDALAHLGGA
jgi:Protein of unknown function (DUF4239)